MKLVAWRQLARYPKSLVIAGGALVVLLPDQAGEAGSLAAYDDRLTPLWRRDCVGGAALLAVDGTAWLLDRHGAWELRSGGALGAGLPLPPRDGMYAAAFAAVEDGFVVAWQHEDRSRTRPAVLERVDRRGAVRWSTTLPLGRVSYEGVVQMRADEGWEARPMRPWSPRSWVATQRPLTVSGDVVLACFSEMPRSGIGCGYAVSLADGTLRFVTQMGPIDEAASLGGGAFLVGYQGYGAFETLRYERDGRVSERWESHGHYVVEDGDLRVIELENVGSRMHLARLLPGGRIDRGDWLDGYHTSAPWRAADGGVYFFRAGGLFVARDLSAERRMTIAAERDAFSTAIVGHDDVLYVPYGVAGRSDGTVVKVKL